MRFTVRRPASAEVSPCCHHPSGGDVACSVHVGVGGPRGAGFALENRLALAVLGGDVPAHRASLRRERGRHRNTTVDTHHAALTRSSDRIRDVGERNMPAEAHPADLGHPHPTEPAVQTLDTMRFDRYLPESVLHTGFAPRRGAVRSAEKVAHRVGEIPQCLLLHGLRAGRQPIVIGTGSGQLSALLVIAGRTTTRLPMPLLLDGQVPHIPGVATMLGEHHHLLSGRKMPITRHSWNVSAATDKLPKGETVSPPPAKARGMHAARIP